MGLLRFSQFSQIPDLFRKIKFRTRERERVQQQIPTDFNSFIVNNGVRITNRGATTGEATIYTVPAGKIFYLVYAELSVFYVAAFSGTINLDIGSFGTRFMVINTSSGNTVTHNVTAPFTTPIKFIEGEIIRVTSNSANLVATGLITGYELDVKREEQRY